MNHDLKTIDDSIQLVNEHRRLEKNKNYLNKNTIKCYMYSNTLS